MVPVPEFADCDDGNAPANDLGICACRLLDSSCKLQAAVKPLSTVAPDGLPETAAAVCSKLPLRVPAPTCQPKAAPGPAPKPRLSQEQFQPESGAEPAVDTAAASMMASGESAGCWLQRSCSALDIHCREWVSGVIESMMHLLNVLPA